MLGEVHKELYKPRKILLNAGSVFFPSRYCVSFCIVIILDLFSVTNIAQIWDLLFVSMHAQMQEINLAKLSLLLVLPLP